MAPLCITLFIRMQQTVMWLENTNFLQRHKNCIQPTMIKQFTKKPQMPFLIQETYISGNFWNFHVNLKQLRSDSLSSLSRKNAADICHVQFSYQHPALQIMVIVNIHKYTEIFSSFLHLYFVDTDMSWTQATSLAAHISVTLKATRARMF